MEVPESGGHIEIPNEHQVTIDDLDRFLDDGRVTYRELGSIYDFFEQEPDPKIFSEYDVSTNLLLTDGDLVGSETAYISVQTPKRHKFNLELTNDSLLDPLSGEFNLIKFSNGVKIDGRVLFGEERRGDNFIKYIIDADFDGKEDFLIHYYDNEVKYFTYDQNKLDEGFNKLALEYLYSFESEKDIDVNMDGFIGKPLNRHENLINA